MFRTILSGAAAAAVLVVAAGAVAGKSPEPVECVKLARTWEAAIDEAKTLNVPIVLHNHGFYCGPCWGMHASVMCNEKYIEFASENTVEVLALQDLQKGIDAKDKRAEEYEAKDEDGNKVRYLVEFPGLTKEEVIALHQSKASSYNDTGGIPFTAVIDPYTEKEMQRWSGGGKPAKDIMEGVLAQKKVLNAEHGPSLSRATLAKVTTEAKRISGALEKSGVTKSMADYRKLEKSLAKEGDAIRKKIEPVLAAILDAATKLLDEADGLAESGDAAGAKKLLDKLGRSLDGTDLEARVRDLAARVKPEAAR